MPDYSDLDSDNDGITDLAESCNPGIEAGTPRSSNATCPTDPDNDGVIGEGVPVVNPNGQPAGGVGSAPVDTDNDGDPDMNDLESDGDGLTDVEEAGLSDPDGDGMVGSGTPVVDENGQIPGTGGEENIPEDTDDDGVPDFQQLDPTAVELISFTAQRRGANDIVVRWATASEVDNFGFRLMRNTTNNLATATSIHFESSAVTTGPGSEYEHVDAGLNPDSYFYWLIDVDTVGLEKAHGPIEFTLTRGWQIFLPITVR